MSSMQSAEAIPLADLSERWSHFEGAPPDDVVDSVLHHYGDEQETRRNLLTSWLAYQLGYSRLLHRREGVESRPLWDLLDPEVYGHIGFQGERALYLVAQSTGHPMQATPHPKAALAAIALWRNARTPAIRSEVELLLRGHPLPDDDRWLHRLVGRFVSIGAARSLERPGLFDLAALQLGSRYWDVAAKIGAHYLVRRHMGVGAGPETEKLVAGCDLAAEIFWREESDWLELMAEAAEGGSLGHPWLEKPVEAAIRATVGDAECHRRFRAYHRQRPYRASHTRLEALYGHLIEESTGPEPKTRYWARRRLLEEIERTSERNPKRALRLVELIAIHEHPIRLGTFRHRLRHALRQIDMKEELDLIDEYLAGLYVATYDIDPHALQFVHRVSERIDWARNPVADARKLELYLKVSDYESAFADLTFEIEGTTLELEDKDASLRVLYFLEKRFEPTSVMRLVRRTLAPVEWMGSTLKTIDPIEDAAERGIELFRLWVEDRDLRDRVVRDYADAGVSIATFDEISELGADFIEDYVGRLRVRRLLMGAGAGLIAGASGPLGSPLVSHADIPAKLALGLEASARFCWYYGFDPREHPDLPLEIMAVALDGPQTDQLGADVLHRSLAEFAIQTSFLVEAIGTRDFGRIIGRTVRGLVEQFSEGGYGDAFAAVVEEIAMAQLHTRAAERRRIPFWGAILGGLMDAAIVYDICESAQVVLNDRFLARKYPDWERKLLVR